MDYSNIHEKSKSKNSIAVRQYRLDGTFIREYKSAMDAGRDLGVRSYCISYCCKGKIGSVKGFLWAYADGSVKERFTRVLKRKVIQKDISGNAINIFDSIKEAGDKTNTNVSLIGRCCKGYRKSTNGFKWEYYDKEPIVFKGTL